MIEYKVKLWVKTRVQNRDCMHYSKRYGTCEYNNEDCTLESCPFYDGDVTPRVDP
jgi:hypothetical protein